MSTTPDLGRNFYNQTLSRGRMASMKAREALRQLIEGDPGPQTRAMLDAKIALQLGIIDETFTEFEHIGQRAKNMITT